MKNTTTTTAPRTRTERALRNNIHGYVTIFTDHGDGDAIIVTVVARNLRDTLSMTRMRREDAREEWSAMRAYCTRVDASKL